MRTCRGVNQISGLGVYWGGPLDQITAGNYNMTNPVTGVTRNLPVSYVIDVGRPEKVARLVEVPAICSATKPLKRACFVTCASAAASPCFAA